MQFVRKEMVGWLAAAWVFALASSPAWGADHRETQATKDDPAADIADVYAWHNTAAGTLTLVVTYGGGAAPTPTLTTPLYDDEVLYTVNLDTEGDFAVDHEILVRFGQKSDGSWGVKVQDLPGSTGDVIGAVGETITANAGSKGKVYAGLVDDPFFFDLEGFVTTLQTGTVSFQSTRDGFEGKNVMAIVLECDLTAARAGGDKLNVWASTGRKKP